MRIEMQQTVSVELSQELTLELQQRAMAILSLQADAKAIDAEIQTEKWEIEKRLKEIGQDKLVVGEYRYSLIPGSGRMSQGDLLAAGVSASQIAAANAKAKLRKGKPSLRVGLASDKEVTGEE